MSWIADGADHEGPYYTMELLQGSDLRDLAPVDVPTACRYLRDVASSLATKAMLEQSNNFIAALVAAASNALAGNLEAARTATELVRSSDPHFRIKHVRYRLPHRQPEVLTRWEDALRKAGMPE